MKNNRLLQKLHQYPPLFWAVGIVLAFFVIASGVWLNLALWFHKPLGEFLSFLAMSVLSLTGLIGLAFFGAKLPSARFLLPYFGGFLAVLVWFVSLTPKGDLAWQDDVGQVLAYTQHGSLITVHNVRNFAWRTEKNYDVNWQTRHYDLNKLNGADLIISDWGISPIVHTMISFNFSDGQHLTFSIETRKEKTENYSALGGFFRKYELLIIAGDEKDLIYTRSNVRNEQVYLYPIMADNKKLQALFLTYLNTAQAIKYNPKWYHTLMSNCTTVIYQMIEQIAPNQLPKDYRILLAGQLPSYLLEYGLLDNRYNESQWKEFAKINQKVQHTNIGTPSNEFSRLMREPLKDNGLDDDK